MKDLDKQRTIAFIAHGSSGKTSLAESILFLTKVTNRLGKVGDGTSVLDFEPEEIKRTISISSAFHSFPWKKYDVHFVDTPGDENFLNDTKTCLQGVDGVVVLVDAVDGVKVNTERVWGYADDYQLPRLVLVNKMDRERADFLKCVNQLNDEFDIPCLPVQIPIGVEANFKGLVNLLDEKAFEYTEGTGEFKTVDVPDDLTDMVSEWREKLIESIAEADDALLEKYLEEGELSPEELSRGLVEAVRSRSLAPVCCSAGIKLIGLPHLLDSITELLPSPLDRGPVQGLNPANQSEISRDPDPDGPFSALVIKSITDAYAGQLTIFRIFSGTLTPDSTFFNVTKDVRERFGQLLTLEGKSQKPIETAGPGTIAAVAKLKETSTGHTLADEASLIVYPVSPPLPAIISYAIAPKSKGDEEKVFSALSKVLDEDVTLRLDRGAQTKEIILSGMGQVHIEATLEKIKRKYGAEVELKTPKVAYKETIKGKTRIQGRYKKQTGGRGQFGDTWLEIEPTARGEGFEFVDRIVGGVIPRQFIPACEKGIVEAMAKGVVSGNPVVDVRVSLVDGSFHTVDSSEMAFKVAASMGFKKGFKECNPTLLEPIVLLTVTVPDEYMGDVIGDINSRRGKVLGVDVKGGKQIIRANVPQAEILQYAPSLTSMTGGRGAFTLEFDHYEEVPAHLQEKIVAEAKMEDEE
ncbi:MAG: elongation factor G [Proteobacteria bacterium]|nr:elongation factor G [Pseudomonadota bacterium]